MTKKYRIVKDGWLYYLERWHCFTYGGGWWREISVHLTKGGAYRAMKRHAKDPKIWKYEV